MTEKIKEQILAVRATGQTNMFDTNMVQVIANKMKFYELVIFIEEYKGDYAKFILTGECYTAKDSYGSPFFDAMKRR